MVGSMVRDQSVSRTAKSKAEAPVLLMVKLLVTVVPTVTTSLKAVGLWAMLAISGIRLKSVVVAALETAVTDIA